MDMQYIKIQQISKTVNL